jgi:hypothetical protein
MIEAILMDLSLLGLLVALIGLYLLLRPAE